MVEPVDPFKGGEFDGFEVAPWPAPVNDLGLVKSVDRLRQCVVIAVADAANRRFDTCFGQPLGVFDRQILAATVGVTDRATSMKRAAIMEGLFQGIEDKSCARGAAGAPTHDPTG